LPDLVERDRGCVWHPYAPPRAHPLFEVVGAEGVRLRLADGRQLVDGMASWWAAIHGYAHPRLEAALRGQLGRMAHVMFGGLTHEPAVALCERLVALTPEPLRRVFLCDSGSVAVEVAIKLALQYWQARGRPERQRLATVRGGYHGDTFGAMSVCDPVTGMHGLFRGVLPAQVFVERPACAYAEPCEERHVAELEQKLRAHRHELAAVILEPIVQGAGGMWFYAPAYLRRVRALCDELGLLLILDEIATGFGRSGELFGCHHAGVAPDLMCLGKALTGGTLSLAATLASDAVCEAIAGAEPGVLMHGPTFMGNPLACAAALASLELLEEEPWRERVARIATQLREELAPCRTLPGVADVRVLGAIGVVELRHPVDMARVQPAFVERGVWIRPFGRLVYCMPPYPIGAQDLAQITGAIREVVAEHATH
jgi:adenosylmethionine-8-amino-7-oxononanoate aminotransferase